MRRHTCFLRIIIVVTLVASGVCYAFGQKVQGDDVFRDVPSSAKERLIERLRLRVEYERLGKWSELFDLLYLPGIDAAERKAQKEAYLTRHSLPREEIGATVTDFEPTAVTATPELFPDSYMIVGCATVTRRGKTERKNEIYIAHLVEGDWYFSGFGEVFQDGSCRLEK
ncbi:MAG: hypothetical protein R2682_07305 [Pyrinomonadaceae bacterium]